MERYRCIEPLEKEYIGSVWVKVYEVDKFPMRKLHILRHVDTGSVVQFNDIDFYNEFELIDN